jgi:hypothetical protein
VSVKVVFGFMLGLFAVQPSLAQDPLTQPSVASTAPAPGKFTAPPCDGDVAVVRLIEITPKGTMAGYLKAVATNLGWFRSHGYADDEMFVTQLMVEDPATHQLTYSKNRVLSFHIRPPFMGGSTGHDAGWNVFHDVYQANSNILTEYNICIPKRPDPNAGNEK